VSDLDLLFMTDSVEEAAAYVQIHTIERFGLRRKKAPQRSRFLRE
jgi:hypothetical protein